MFTKIGYKFLVAFRWIDYDDIQQGYSGEKNPVIKMYELAQIYGLRGKIQHVYSIDDMTYGNKNYEH